MKSKRKKTPASVKKLGLSMPVTEQDVKQAYFAKARETHPDQGGSASDFIEVKRAFDEAIEIAKRNGKRLLWIGAQLPIYMAQEQTIDLVKEWGGKAVIQTLSWLEDTVGSDFAAMGHRLTEIDLSQTTIGDEQLIQLSEEVEALPYLESLNLSETEVSAVGVERLPQMASLKVLDLRDTRVPYARRRLLAKQLVGVRVEGSSWLEQAASLFRK